MSCNCGCNAAVQIEMRSRQLYGLTSVCGLADGDGKLYGKTVQTTTYDRYGPSGTVTGQCEIEFTSTATGELCEYEMVDGVPTAPSGCCGTPSGETTSNDCEGLPNCPSVGVKTNCRQFLSSGISYEEPRDPAPAPNMLELPPGWSEWGDLDPIDVEDFRGGALPALSIASGFGSSRTSTDASYEAFQDQLEFRLKEGTKRAPVMVRVTLREYLDSGGGSYTETVVDFDIPKDFTEVSWSVPLPSATGYIAIETIQFFAPAEA